MDPSNSNADRIRGLDTLRLVAAAWVACSGGARPPIGQMLPVSSGDGAFIAMLDRGLFSSASAAILFFVISGLVIHHVNAGCERIDLANHYTRRLLRIAPPVLIVWMIYAVLGPTYMTGLQNILWSVYCEIGFYLVYPALFALFRRLGTERVFFAATAVACVAACLNWQVTNHYELAILPLLAICLPGFLLGCILAEMVSDPEHAMKASGGVWAWRIAAVAISAALKIPAEGVALHIGYPASQLMFAIFAFFWLEREIAWFRIHTPPRWMEAGGGMSFSLYLVHPAVISLFATSEFAGAPLRGVFGAGAQAWFIAWAALIATLALATTVFYLVIESPSHRLARQAGGWASRHESANQPAPAITA